jgi:hypothetical protein
VANYKASIKTNNGIITTQEKTNKKQQKQRKMNKFRLLTLKQDLKKSVNLHIKICC